MGMTTVRVLLLPSFFLWIIQASHTSSSSDSIGMGDIRWPDWTLKDDYEDEMLLEMGWNKEQLTGISNMYRIIHLQLTQPNVRRRTHNVTNQHYAQLCPANVSIDSVIFGKEMQAHFILNKYLNSPQLRIKSVETGEIHTSEIGAFKQCFYQNADETPFATLSLDDNGNFRAFVEFYDQTIVIEPWSGKSQSQQLPSSAASFPSQSYLSYVLKRTKPETESANCGSSTTASLGKTRRNNLVKRQKQNFHPSQAKRELVRTATNWIELALIVDENMVDLMRTYPKLDTLQVALSLTNLVDQIFQPLSTRVILTYLETWSGNNSQIHFTHSTSSTLLNLMSYSTQNLYALQFDSLMLLTYNRNFSAGEIGLASSGSVCTLKSVGFVNVMDKMLDLTETAAQLAHMIAHNLGINDQWDSDSDDCVCPMENGCLMHSSLSKRPRGIRPIFSSCSQDDFINTLQLGQGLCLITSPFQDNPVSTTCGNGIIDVNETCDCGGVLGCLEKNSCCDGMTCLLKDGAECDQGPCCTKQCKLVKAGSLCRNAKDDCDLPEFCDGLLPQCPPNGYKTNGYYCGQGKSYCFNRTCVTHDEQCRKIWGPKSHMATVECFEKYNTQAMFSGHCGLDDSGQYLPCAPENVLCGNVHCEGGSVSPINSSLNFSTAMTVITHNEKQLECKSQISDLTSLIKSTLAKDGSKCGINKVCITGACEDVYSLAPESKCPSLNSAVTCSGHGFCNDLNQCSCHPSFTGPDCSRRVSRSHADSLAEKYELESKAIFNIGKRKPLQDGNDIIDNFGMLIIMAILIVTFLIIFLIALLCYRRTGKESIAEHYTEETGTDSNSDGQTSPELYKSPSFSSPFVHSNFLQKRNDVACSPFTKMHSSERHLTLPMYCRELEERLSDEWTSVSDDIQQQHLVTFASRSRMPYSASKKSFRQNSLDDCPTCCSQFHVRKDSSKETCDVSCQINMDLDLLYDMPPPMSELATSRLAFKHRSPIGSFGSQHVLWRPLKAAQSGTSFMN